MKCKICDTDNGPCFTSTIMGKYDVDYFQCETCGFIQTEEPYWLGEAYARPINITDTGYMERNLYLSAKLTILLFFHFKVDGLFLDYAGGYGVFVRLMRDIGFDFRWKDKYSNNLFASGFEWDEDTDTAEATTAFECFEHFEDPVHELECLLKISRNIILSTKLVPEPRPEPDQWWYYGLDHGQHISLYTKDTFLFIAKRYGLHYTSFGDLHFLTEEKVPFHKIRLIALSKLGLHKLIKGILTGKTREDYTKMCSRVKEEAGR